jgi:hypothetical protein
MMGGFAKAEREKRIGPQRANLWRAATGFGRVGAHFGLIFRPVGVSKKSKNNHQGWGFKS